MQQLGKKYEGDLIEAAITTLNTKGKGFEVTSIQKDLYEGQDGKIYGVPVDFTCNFWQKDHMDVLPEKMELYLGTEVRFGVRTGNTHNGFTPFKDPVLVIGIDGDMRFLRNWMENVVTAFQRKLGDIIELGSAQYWDWMDENADLV